MIFETLLVLSALNPDPMPYPPNPPGPQIGDCVGTVDINKCQEDEPNTQGN